MFEGFTKQKQNTSPNFTFDFKKKSAKFGLKNLAKWVEKRFVRRVLRYSAMGTVKRTLLHLWRVLGI